jgi:hypothetical protein
MKNKIKNKYFLFLAFFILFIFLSTGFVHALEITYPNIPGLPSLNENSPNINAYVKYWFGLLIYIAGIISLISFVVGAVGLISPSVEAHGQAKDRMWGATLGLTLTFASFIIINTINTHLTVSELTPLSALSGVYYENASTQERLACPQSNVDTTAITSTGFDSIRYCCNSECSGGEGPILMVWAFPEKGLETGNGDLSEVQTKEVSCGNTADISGSFRMAFQTPGIYAYLDSNCSTFASAANTSSGNITDRFKNNIRGVKIVNDDANGIKYGAIFHQTDLKTGGGCGTPMIDPGCQPINITNATSVNIFKINQTASDEAAAGVTFYSEPYGWDTGANAGFYDVPKKDIKADPLWNKNPSAMEFKWDNVTQSVPYKTTNTNFQIKPGSIIMNGDYLVALYSSLSGEGETEPSGATEYCQTFESAFLGFVPNLNTDSIIASGSSYTDFNSVYIIPTRP